MAPVSTLVPGLACHPFNKIQISVAPFRVRVPPIEPIGMGYDGVPRLFNRVKPEAVNLIEEEL